MRLSAPYRLTLALQIRKEKKQTETMREQKKEKRESKKRKNKKQVWKKTMIEKKERKDPIANRCNMLSCKDR